MHRSWHHRTDAEILAGVAADPDAFDAFYRRYEALVAGWLLRRCADPHLAADLAAETFARALLHAGAFRDRGGQPAVGWLLAIAGNLHRQYLRRGAATQRAQQRLQMHVADWSPDTLDAITALADREAWNAALTEALSALPAAQRAAVLAHVVHDVSYADLADTHHTTEATIRQRVSRGLSRLRDTVTRPEA